MCLCYYSPASLLTNDNNDVDVDGVDERRPKHAENNRTRVNNQRRKTTTENLHNGSRSVQINESRIHSETDHSAQGTMSTPNTKLVEDSLHDFLGIP